MREILFRGKRVDNGEWVYGSLLIQSGEWLSKDEKAPDEWQIFGKRGEQYLVDSKTVGQYTGLTDKNGKKIFIDDIVEAKQPPLIQRGVVTQLSDGLYVFKGKKYHDLIDFKLEDVNLERCLSVIGNIHDNPELLEVGE